MKAADNPIADHPGDHFTMLDTWMGSSGPYQNDAFVPSKAVTYL